MSIYLIDNVEDGHHSIYQKTLNRIDNTKILNKLVEFEDIKKDFIKGYRQRKEFIKYIHNKTLNSDTIHFLYIDSLYKCPFIHKLLNNNRKYIGTLHWIPTDKLRSLLLKKFSKKMKYIIVHSEFLKKELNDIGIYNVKCIDYPSFLGEKNKINCNKTDKIVLSCLGGTRKDKGLDILIKSFEYIDESMKDKLIFNICGVEQDIKYKDIIENAEANNINIRYKNRFITQEEYENEIYGSDIILLPYKKIFTGNSGPMTDGIYANKFIIGPDNGNLGFLIKKYSLGATFKSEDYVDLAYNISNIDLNNLTKSHSYKDKIKVNKFIENHIKLYSQV